jgi:hypothetical protein
MGRWINNEKEAEAKMVRDVDAKTQMLVFSPHFTVISFFIGYLPRLLVHLLLHDASPREEDDR